MRASFVIVLVLTLLPGGAAAQQAVVKGVGVSPEGFPLDYSRLPAFFSEAGGIPGGGVLWNGAWRDDAAGGTNAGAIPAAVRAVLESAAPYGYTPALVFGWRSGETLFLRVPADARNDWTNTVARDLFAAMLGNVAAAYAPPFVFLGNENDFHYESNPADYANWIEFYNRAYDVIKAASPQTQVGPVFSYEHLAGRGGLNGWTTAHWAALEMHDLTRVDVVGITLYPWLDRATAATVPADYLDPLWSRIGSRPVAITETGWPAENLGGLNPPWETNQSAPVTWLSRLSAMIRGRPVPMVNYLFLHAMQNPGGSPLAWKLFGSVSLRDASGNARDVYGAWLAFQRGMRRRAVRH